MLFFILGTILGVAISLVVIVVTLYYQPEIKQRVNSLGSKFKAKGELFEPENELVVDWLKELDENKTNK